MKATLPALIVVLTLATPVMAAEHTPVTTRPGPLSTFAAAEATTLSNAVEPQLPVQVPEPASLTSLSHRPPALGALYVTLAALNVLDVYSTNRAIASGAREVNPVMASAGGRLASVLAIKAATTGSSIVLAERLWKKNRAAAIVTMVAVNGLTAAIVARNFRNAR